MFDKAFFDCVTVIAIAIAHTWGYCGLNWMNWHIFWPHSFIENDKAEQMRPNCPESSLWNLGVQRPFSCSFDFVSLFCLTLSIFVSLCGFVKTLSIRSLACPASLTFILNLWKSFILLTSVSHMALIKGLVLLFLSVCILLFVVV